MSNIRGLPLPSETRPHSKKTGSDSATCFKCNSATTQSLSIALKPPSMTWQWDDCEERQIGTRAPRALPQEPWQHQRRSKLRMGKTCLRERSYILAAVLMGFMCFTRLEAWCNFAGRGTSSRTSRVSTSRGLTLYAKLDDLDGVVLVPMEEDDATIEDMKPPPLPDLKVKEENKETPQYPALDGFTVPKPRIAKTPVGEDLEDGKKSLTGETIATPGLELMAGKSAKPGRNKRWLKGRGTAKRRKLEENAKLEKWLADNGVWVSEAADWGRPAASVSMAVETREQTENEVSGPKFDEKERRSDSCCLQWFKFFFALCHEDRGECIKC
eukprot:s684_g11.t1